MLAVTLREPPAGLPAARDADVISAQLVTSVNATPLHRDPYCHIHARGCFPEVVYEGMLKHLPNLAICAPFNPKRYRRSNGDSTRGQFHPTKENLAKLPRDAAMIWRNVVAAVSSSAFRHAVFSKLSPDIADRFGVSRSAVPHLPSECQVYLTRDTEDFGIKPHPDGLNKIVTMLFYLPSDDTQPELGTSIYRKKDGLAGLLPHVFEEVKRAPFVRNSCFAFAVSDTPRRRSWHGRVPLKGFTGTRDTLVVLFVQSLAPKAKKWHEKVLPTRIARLGR